MVSPQDVIDWAKKNKFRFRQGQFGNEKTGCAATALWCMKNPGKADLQNTNSEEIYKSLGVSTQDLFRIIRGFESPYILIDEPFRNLGRDIYNLAKQEGLLV